MREPVLERLSVVERLNLRDRSVLSRIWLPLVLVLFAAGLRFPGLFSYPFEQDELYTVIEATELFDSRLQPGIQARPLYYLLHHTVINALPQSHFGLRLPAFVFGVIGVWLTWVAGSRIFGRAAGGIATLMVAISPWHLHASGMARYWSLVYLLAITFYFFLHKADSTRHPRDYLTALLFLVLGSVTHPSFLFPVIGIVPLLFLESDEGRFRWRWPSRRAVVYLWGPFGILVVLALGSLLMTGSQSEVRNFDGRGLLATFRLLPAMAQWMTPTIFATGMLGSILLLFDTTPVFRRWGATGVAGSCVALLLLSAASMITNVYADYGMAVLPFFIISTGALVQLAASRISSGRRAFEWAVVGVMVAGVLPSTVSHLSDGTRFDYRPAFQRITAIAPEIPVLTWPIILQRRYAPELDGRELQMTEGFLQSQLMQMADFWTVIPVQRYGIVLDGSGTVANWLNANCRLSVSHQRPRLDYRMYRVDLYRCGSGA